MALIIDTNRFNEFFEQPLYEKIRETLTKPTGPKLLIGGKTYRKELGEKRMKILEEYGNINKLITLSDDKVNTLENVLNDSYTHKDFDDPHIMAICKISGCRLIITNDIRMKTPIEHFFITKHRPKLITSDSNIDLIYDSRYRIT